MSDRRLTRAGIAAILARLKKPEEVTRENIKNGQRFWSRWPGMYKEDLSTSLLDLVQRQDEELARVSQNSYAHMCRWDHVQIGHSESGNDERCPLCQKIDEADALRAELDALKGELAYLKNNFDSSGLWPSTRMESDQHLMPDGATARLAMVPDWCIEQIQRPYIARVKRLRAGLIRLRDCDWVITLPDRMDAVRDIAREVLEEDQNANHP